METKQEPSAVWSQTVNSDASNPTQVHFEGGTMAQIVYSGDQADRAEQQVVYAADGNSYTSVESAEHTLVYIHPADGAQTVFADQPQVAYIQQDGTTQQVTVLLPGGQNMNAANLHVLSNVADGPQAILAPVSQEQLSASNSLTDMADITDPPTSPLGATDSTDDSDEAEDDDSEMDDWELRHPQRFDPHSLWCEECNSANSMDCPMHGPLHPIPNRPVLSKARASLPQILYIDRFLGGVFSKRRIPKRTQFGPVEAPLVPQSELQDHFFHLKVYKSASKRKAHILKNHPGAELPPSIRKLRPAAPGEPDPMLSTHTQLTGTIATAPVCCPHCAKQYSSKTKMVQHIRKKHPEFAQLANSIQTPVTTAVISSAPAVINADGATAEAVVTTDLLTQAMTELSQTLTTDFRTTQGDYQRIQYIPVSQPAGGLSQPQHIQLQVVQVAPASSPHSQAPTVDVSQLHDPHGYSQHSIQVQHIQVSEPSGSTQSTSQPLSPASQQPSQDLSPAQLTPVTLAQSHSLQASSGQQPGAVQHAYIPGNWNYRGYSSEIQMMALPHAQYVIAEASTPISGVNSNQVKTTHYVISEGQSELETKQDAPQDTTPAQTEHLEQQPATQQATTQYIITTTTNGSGTSEVHITKP
uniref:PR domain containing 10 n=1 Tax=Nothobranchius kuhntae TaxID=321403 RepID=A0A1A8IYT7_NOTKU